MNRAMWTATTRAQHMRDGLRLASDVTDAEWSVVEPLLAVVSSVGRPPAWPSRELVNAISSVLGGRLALSRVGHAADQTNGSLHVSLESPCRL
jgi:hypothetical protein